MKTFNGIGIQHKKSGRIYSLDGWERKDHNPDEARGIAIGNGNHSLCLYKNAGKDICWSSNTDYLVPGVFTSGNSYNANRDFNGKENTDALLKAVENGTVRNAPAAQWCRDIGGEWYLPGGGELLLIMHNMLRVEEYLNAINGNAVNALYRSYIWTSSQVSARRAWFWNSLNDGISSEDKNLCDSFGIIFCYILACAAL